MVPLPLTPHPNLYLLSTALFILTSNRIQLQSSFTMGSVGYYHLTLTPEFGKAGSYLYSKAYYPETLKPIVNVQKGCSCLPVVKDRCSCLPSNLAFNGPFNECIATVKLSKPMEESLIQMFGWPSSEKLGHWLKPAVDNTRCDSTWVLHLTVSDSMVWNPKDINYKCTLSNEGGAVSTFILWYNRLV